MQANIRSRNDIALWVVGTMFVVLAIMLALSLNSFAMHYGGGSGENMVSYEGQGQTRFGAEQGGHMIGHDGDYQCQRDEMPHGCMGQYSQGFEPGRKGLTGEQTRGLVMNYMRDTINPNI